MPFFKTLAGPGYVILNILRVMNIIVLLSVVVACTVMLAKMSVNNSFFIFDAATYVIISCLSLFLIITELNIFRNFFVRHWPIFAQHSGLAPLGATMIVLGIVTLGHLNNEDMTTGAIGLAFWRVVLGAGIVAIIFGVLNITLSFIFCDNDIGVTARHIRAHGAVAANKAASKEGSHKSFQLGRKDSLPTYQSSTSSPRSSSTRSGGARFPVKISSPINEHVESPKSPSTSSLVVPNLAAPNLAHHPAMYSDRV